MKNEEKSRTAKTVNGIYQSLDLITAILLLTGQITIRGVFINQASFSLSLAGPITGGPKITGTDESSNFILDVLDIATAFLLILGEISVIGTLIASGRFTIVVSGPPFGRLKTEAYVPEARQFFLDFRRRVFRKYNANNLL